jgi:hypothetical protein
MDKSSLSFLGGDSLRVKLGKIETPYLSTEAKFIGLESLLHENLCKLGQTSVPLMNNQSIFQASHSKPESTEHKASASPPPDQQVSDQMESMTVNDHSGEGVNDEYNANLNNVRAYILDNATCVITNIVSDTNIDADTVKGILNDLEKGKLYCLPSCLQTNHFTMVCREYRHPLDERQWEALQAQSRCTTRTCREI